MASSRSNDVRVMSVDEYMQELRSEFQPRTLHEHNTERLDYLPIFPNKREFDEEHLLLANVSGKSS